MTTRSDTLETTAIALELLRRIPRQGMITARQLNVQLESAGYTRDLRTVQRVLAMLCEHFDIECDDRTKPYGYRWKERSGGMALPFLSEHESLLLMLAKQHLQNLMPASVLKSMEGFFYQAQNNLGPAGRAAEAGEWLKKTRVISETLPMIPAQIATGVLEQVSSALYHNNWLNVEYRNLNGKATAAKIMPLGLAQQGPRLYLACRFDGFDDTRSLAVQRIVNAEVSTLTFDRPRDFDLAQYDADGRFDFGNGKWVRLRFLISKASGRYLEETWLSTDQTIVELEDRYEVTATVVDGIRLKRWLLSYGAEVSGVEKVAVAGSSAIK